MDRARLWRWRTRAADGRLDDLRPGGNPLHALLDWEVEEVLALAEEWGPVDRSHRKLAHRGSYLDRVYVSPSTVDRVLAAHGLVLPRRERPAPRVRKPWPAWVDYRPNQVWGWDVTHFTRCRRAPCCFGIVDLVSRKWIATLLPAEESTTQARVLFLDALEAEGLLTGRRGAARAPRRLRRRRPGRRAHPGPVGRERQRPGHDRPLDAGVHALCSIAQHFGRPGVPTDQAHIETLWGHVKAEWPQLTTIDDPAVLGAELDRVRAEYNGVRQHEAIGYVTPDDEHEGRGQRIRQARIEGLARAAEARKDHRRRTKNDRPETQP